MGISTVELKIGTSGSKQTAKFTRKNGLCQYLKTCGYKSNKLCPNTLIYTSRKKHFFCFNEVSV